jgi:beta-mannosidase
MGSIFWQLNDCWPAASWSSIDYHGRWKALQYYARRFYAPLLVSPHQENGLLSVYVVSDMTRPVAARLRVRLMALDGSVMREETVPVQIPSLSSKVYMEKGLDRWVPGGTDAAGVFVSADLSTEGRVVSRNVVYLLPTKQMHLRAAPILADVKAEGAVHRVRLTSNALARSVFLSFGTLDVEPSDNYFDLLPGESVDVWIKGAASADDLRRNLATRSLSDAFEPAP